MCLLYNIKIPLPLPQTKLPVITVRTSNSPPQRYLSVPLQNPHIARLQHGEKILSHSPYAKHQIRVSRRQIHATQKKHAKQRAAHYENIQPPRPKHAAGVVSRALPVLRGNVERRRECNAREPVQKKTVHIPAPAVEHVKGGPVTHHEIARTVNVTER